MCNSYKLRIRRWGGALLLGGVLSILSGCGDDPLTDYRQAVAAVTGGEVTVDRPELLPYPGRRERALVLEEVRIGFMGYLGLTGCRLMNLVSERNSALGKVMPPSRRLAYEVDFLVAARECRERTLAGDNPDQTFIASLDEMVAQKRRQLSRVLWLATFDSPEFQQAMSLAASPLGVGEEEGFGASLEAVAYLVGLGRNLERGTLDIGELEDRYQALQAHEYGGRLFQTLADLTVTLEAAARQLESLTARPLCPQGRAVEQARLLETVYRDHYRQGIEPYLERVRDQGQRWLGALNELRAVTGLEPPPAFEGYWQRMLSREADGSLWQGFERARQRHDRAWIAMLRQCGLSYSTAPRAIPSSISITSASTLPSSSPSNWGRR